MSDCVRVSKYDIQDGYWSASYQKEQSANTSAECQRLALLEPNLCLWYFQNGTCSVAPISTVSNPLKKISSPGAVGGMTVCQDAQGFLGKFIILLCILILVVGFYFYMRSCKKCNEF